MENLKDEDYKKTVFAMEEKGKQQLITGVITNKPELFKEFSKERQ